MMRITLLALFLGVAFGYAWHWNAPTPLVIKELPVNCREVTVTQYHYLKPNRTAILEKPVPGWTAAISRELLYLGWMGRKVYIEGLGVFKINDVMAASVDGYQIDIYAGSKEKAMKFGKREAVSATVL